MSETVFILGAGASKEAGGPLMWDFLDVADYLKRDPGSAFKSNFDLVFQGIAELRVAQSKARIDIDNLESVFGAFEIAALFGTLGRLSVEETSGLAAAMRRLIARTLELRIQFPDSPEGTRPPVPYGEFARLLRKGKMGPSVSVMTFNYDVALDYALHANGLTVDYCLLPQPIYNGFEVMKLHGSLNWARCTKCGHIEPLPPAELEKHLQGRPNRQEDGWSTMEFVGYLDQRKHCAVPFHSDPVIVPPTWSKTEHYRAINAVWKRAASHLARAENIVVIGYSLPPSDQFFPYLYALGTMSETRLKKFIVCDPDAEGRVGRRFKRLLGQTARDRFVPIPRKFSAGLDKVIAALARP